MRPIIKKTLIIISIIFLGLFFRIYEKTPSSLWTDEFATYWISSAPSLSECISRATPTQGQSPFYYILEWFVLQKAPHTENSLRLISLIGSLISIGLIYLIALEIFTVKKVTSDLSCSVSGKKEADSLNHKTEKYSDYQIGYIPAIFASLLFAMDSTQIYYAQEARPYSLAIMFALFSQLFFMKLIRKSSIYNEILYIIFSALIFYTHYIIGSMLLVQNIWVLFILCNPESNELTRRENMTFIRWVKIQIILIALLFPLLFHLIPILRKASKWTWLKSGGLSETIAVFGTLFNAHIVVIFAVVFILLTVYKFDSNNASENLKRRNFYYLILWFITPPLFAYFATKLLNTSLLDARYMILSLVPSYLLAAYFINSLKSRNAKFFLISFILFAYLSGILLPALKKNGRFSSRIPHDWRSAISYLNKNFQFGDVIVLRSGFIKENWAPEAPDPIISEYIKAPLNSFYFSPILQPSNNVSAKNSNITIYNMTYTKEIDFYPYYDRIFDNCAKRKRVWIIGVNPPNTNYLVSQLPEILRNSHRKYFEKDFSGVYLVMLKKER